MLKHLIALVRHCTVQLIQRLGYTALFLATNLYAETRSAEIQASPRIVSLAPSITETLFAVGAGSQIVGVTRYCRFPAQTDSIPKIGGYYDPNYEAILALRPTLVLRLKEHVQVARMLDTAGLTHISVDHQSLAGILDSITHIGQYSHAEKRAQQLRRQIEDHFETIRNLTRNTVEKRVLIAFGRSLEQEFVTKVYIAGNDQFYSPLLAMANARNAYTGTVAFPVVSAEGLVELKPDVIIDITTDPLSTPAKELAARNQWLNTFAQAGLKPDQIHLLPYDYMIIPGPRVKELALALSRAIHPDLDFSAITAVPVLPQEQP